MDTLGLSTPFILRQCSQCQGGTKFYCYTCKHDLSLLCKEKHDIDSHTKNHHVVIYPEKFCHSCVLSVREFIDIIRSEPLYNSCVLLDRIKTCPPQNCHRQSQQMSSKAQRLKDLIDTVVCDVTRYRGLLIARMRQQKRKLNRRLVLQLQNYEDRHEHSANRAVQFLLFIKTSRVSQIKNSRVPQIKDSPNQLLSVITEIRMSTGKRQVGIGECVKLTSPPVLHASVCVTDVRCVLHISGATSDRIRVSDRDNLILTDTTGHPIHRVTDITLSIGGRHTVSSSGELIYIDCDDNINKLSIDNKTVTTLLESLSPWTPVSVYCSPFTGDLMVGMCDRNTRTGKIICYNSTGKHILQNKHNTGSKLYTDPRYITENKNGDIIVSDWIECKRGAVVVTERGGRHRFSYTGPPSESSLWPRGICTDALSHILVCDYKTHTVQMIDKDGHFLSVLLTPRKGRNVPYSLHYDALTHLLWVGSQNTNKVSVYRYIQWRDTLTNDSEDELTSNGWDFDGIDVLTSYYEWCRLILPICLVFYFFFSITNYPLLLLFLIMYPFFRSNS